MVGGAAAAGLDVRHRPEGDETGAWGPRAAAAAFIETGADPPADADVEVVGAGVVAVLDDAPGRADVASEEGELPTATGRGGGLAAGGGEAAGAGRATGTVGIVDFAAVLTGCELRAGVAEPALGAAGARLGAATGAGVAVAPGLGAAAGRAVGMLVAAGAVGRAEAAAVDGRAAVGERVEPDAAVGLLGAAADADALDEAFATVAGAGS